MYISIYLSNIYLSIGGVIDFLKSSLHLVPCKRPTISAILSLPLFTIRGGQYDRDIDIDIDRQKGVKVLIQSISG
jgi:hypothetical protein